MRKGEISLVLLISLFSCISAGARSLLTAWHMQSSAAINSNLGGSEISAPGFNVFSWYTITVPTTGKQQELYRLLCWYVSVCCAE